MAPRLGLDTGRGWNEKARVLGMDVNTAAMAALVAAALSATPIHKASGGEVDLMGGIQVAAMPASPKAPPKAWSDADFDALTWAITAESKAGLDLGNRMLTLVTEVNAFLTDYNNNTIWGKAASQKIAGFRAQVAAYKKEAAWMPDSARLIKQLETTDGSLVMVQSVTTANVEE